ncbi:FAD-binding oxidoreductase [Halorussus salinus]|uniref:FAD-binding oxidoreductase n=1 Tax=Halorussus salinus TaxID=1364935 RepID=UPI0010921EDE|nr:FAD-binding oxidoreductase [Halorussus salinus]
MSAEAELKLVSPDAFDEFAESIRGDIVFSDAENYDDVREIWNGLVDKHPTAIVQCQGAADVAKSVEFTTEHNIEFSVRGGGHHQSGSSLVDDGLVIDLSEMTSVHVDPAEQVARVEPGCRARDVLMETQHYGLATPTGSAADVGIPGSTLGGGIGWIRRKHGLGIDALRSVDVVTPDGDLVHASPKQNEDLFWAMRGGGGNFGIVTSFKFDLSEVGPVVPALGVFYPGDEAHTVLKTYRELSQDAPDELTTLALNSHVPDLPPMPDELVGEEAVSIMGCYAGDDMEAGQEAIQPFREITEPLLDMSEPMPYLMLHELGTQLFPDGRNYCHRSVYVEHLSDEILDLVVDHAEEAPSSLSGIGIWHLGGAIADVANDETAYPWRDKEYLITVEANWEDGGNDANLEWARTGDEVFREVGGVGAYGGFTGVSDQDSEDFTDRVYGENVDRLAEIKAKYDTGNSFDTNVNVVPSEID